MWHRFVVALPIAALAIGGSTACATKKFVRTSVADVNDKVDSLGRSVEGTQERIRQNEGKIGDVDQRAQAAAGAAQTAANQAGDAAKAANSAAQEAQNMASNVGGKFDAFDKNSRKLVFEVVLNDAEGNFKSGKAELPDETKMKIDQMVQQLKQDPKNVYIEIEGHTDNVGDKAFNEKLGLDRAQAVERYLYEQYQIPLHKMNVISYGKDKPIAPNNTRDGRAQNRRVVIKVLA
jgi:outer membrane protein OmpA-like peptidoglycan-associated protein